MRRLLLIVGLVVAFVLLVTANRSGSAQGTPTQPLATPVAPAGARAVVSRGFAAVQGSRKGAVALDFIAMDFGTAAQAQSGFVAEAAALPRRPDQFAAATLTRVSAPRFKDDSEAFMGPTASDQPAGTVAVLLIRDGQYVYVYASTARGDNDPWSDLLAVPFRVFGGSPAPGARPASTLADRLPGFSDLPPGYALRSGNAATPVG